MANDWLRLWHDMPTDPKFRTIAKKSGQSISEVMSVYIHLLVSASRNVTRGHVDVTTEDISSALDIEEDAVSSILNAMEGRVIDENRLSGWEKRQPKREDFGDSESGAKSAAERKRAQRDRDNRRDESRNVTLSHTESRNVTLDTDKDKDIDAALTTDADSPPVATPKKGLESEAEKPKRATRLPAGWVLPKAWGEWALEHRKDWSADDVRLCSDKFADYWRSKSGKDATKIDWLGTWRNWVRNDRTQPAVSSHRSEAQRSIFAGAI